MQTLTLSNQNLKSYIDFLFPRRDSRNRWECSTEHARHHMETYIRTTRLVCDYKLPKKDFIRALRKEGFLANWHSCNISLANMKTLEAANNLVVEGQELADRVSKDTQFLIFICTSIRQHLESERRNKQYKVLYDDLELHDAYKYNDELFTIFLLPDRLLIRKESNSIIETNN